MIDIENIICGGKGATDEDATTKPDLHKLQLYKPYSLQELMKELMKELGDTGDNNARHPGSDEPKDSRYHM